MTETIQLRPPLQPAVSPGPATISGARHDRPARKSSASAPGLRPPRLAGLPAASTGRRRSLPHRHGLPRRHHRPSSRSPTGSSAAPDRNLASRHRRPRSRCCPDVDQHGPAGNGLRRPSPGCTAPDCADGVDRATYAPRPHGMHAYYQRLRPAQWPPDQPTIWTSDPQAGTSSRHRPSVDGQPYHDPHQKVPRSRVHLDWNKVTRAGLNPSNSQSSPSHARRPVST